MHDVPGHCRLGKHSFKSENNGLKLAKNSRLKSADIYLHQC